MKEYRAIKEKHTFLEMCRTPEIAADITRLPVDLLGIDAAIMFSDILVTAEAMGGKLHFENGVGTRFDNPVRTGADIDALTEPDVDARLGYEAVMLHLGQHRLNGRIPLIGVAGAPLKCLRYLVEGKSVRDIKDRTNLRQIEEETG